jgi:hypothetical protein
MHGTMNVKFTAYYFRQPLFDNHVNPEKKENPACYQYKPTFAEDIDDKADPDVKTCLC